MIKKFVIWESAHPAALDSLPKTIAAQVKRFVVPDGPNAIDAGEFPLPIQLAIRRYLNKAGVGGEVTLSSQDGTPLLALRVAIALEDLELSVRSTNCLRAASVNTLEDLLEMSAEALLELPHFGAKCLREVMDLLDQMGCALRSSPPINSTERGNAGATEMVFPLAGLLKFEEFLKDLPICDSLRRSGWLSVIDLSIHSLHKVSSIANLDEDQNQHLSARLHEIGIELPLTVPEWVQYNLVSIRAAFEAELAGYLETFRNVPERSSHMSAAKSLYEELQALIPKKYNLEKRKIVSLLFGFEGEDPMTLDAVARATLPPLTRERIRQIALPVTNALSDPNVERPWLLRTVQCLEQLAPCSSTEAEMLLIEEQIIGKLITVASVLSLAKRANIHTELVLEGRNLRSTQISNHLSELAKRAAKLSSHWGVADWLEVSDGLTVERLSIEDRTIPGAAYLDDERRYFVFPNRENSLANRLARILAVAPSLPLADAYRGLFRDTRTDKSRLPEALFIDFCRLWNWCRVEGDLLQVVATLPSVEASGDDLVVLLLKEVGRPLKRRAILALAQQHGLSESTVAQALSYSNVIASHGGYFSVIGDPRLYETQIEIVDELEPLKQGSILSLAEAQSNNDSIFPSCINPKAFVESVVLGIRAQMKRLQISAQWSVAELGLSHIDRRRLLDWGLKADWDFRSDIGSYRFPDGELTRKRTALGLTFLLFASVADHEFSDSGSIWPAIEAALGDEQRDNFMFRPGVPKLALRDGIEDACRQFGLRHGFEDSGQQVMWRTVGLQFGLRRSHLPHLQRMLGEPITSQPVAIQLLLATEGPNSSLGFRSAWLLLSAIRSGSVSDTKASEDLKKNQWLSVFSVTELLSACRTTSPTLESDSFVDAEVKQDAYAYFSSPRLVLDARDVYLEFDLSSDAPAWANATGLTFLCEEPFRKERIQIKNGGWTMTGGAIRLPLSRRGDPRFRFQMLHGREVALEEQAGVRLDAEHPFLLFRDTGGSINYVDELVAGSALFILATSHVQITGIARESSFRVVLNGRARLTIVNAPEIPSVRISKMTGELLWSGEAERFEDRQKNNLRIEIAGGRWGQRTRITVPSLPFIPNKLRLNSGEVVEIDNRHGHLTVESSPGLSRAQSARIYSSTSSQVRSMPASLIHLGDGHGAAIERQGKWTTLNGSETLDGATLSTSRLLAKVQNATSHQELCWTEGCRALSRLKVYGGSLLNVFGIGEPLRISGGIYNRPEPLLNVAQALTDDGFLRTVHEESPGRWAARLPFETDLEDRHSLWVWSDATACPSEIPRSSISKDGFTVRWEQPQGPEIFGWAVSFAGQRVGSTCLKVTWNRFVDHLGEHWPEVVEWVRWWHVPVLQDQCRRVAQPASERFPVETLTAWNAPISRKQELVFDELREEAWATASRELLWNWRPTPAQSVAVARNFELLTGDIEKDSADRADIPGLGRLARVSPLLLTRVIAKALPELYSFSLRELAILVGLLLKAVNENALSESFRIKDMCQRYAQGESRLDGEFISRSILNASSAEYRGEAVEQHNLRAAFHQSGLRELVTIFLLKELLGGWRNGATQS